MSRNSEVTITECHPLIFKIHYAGQSRVEMSWRRDNNLLMIVQTVRQKNKLPQKGEDFKWSLDGLLSKILKQRGFPALTQSYTR